MKTETPFDLVVHLIGVEAVIIGPTARARVTLILDTGAAMTTLVPRIARAIGYTEAHRTTWSVTRTAAAEERGFVVQSDVETLGFRFPKHRVVVAELGYDIDGLIGLNFLRHFNTEIRFAERRILLERLAP